MARRQRCIAASLPALVSLLALLVAVWANALTTSFAIPTGFLRHVSPTSGRMATNVGGTMISSSLTLASGGVVLALSLLPRRSSTSQTLRGAKGEAEGKIKLFSPAKVNLFLRIIRRRPDGYHDLASLFHTVAFSDSLEIKVLPDAEKDALECNLPGVPVDESNLVIRALKLFREKSGIERFFGVKLEKQIPAQAGMGGGSSNAATAFFGANLLCGSPASPEDLIRWGDDPVIGSDATFFLSEGTAYCTGRGEIVTPIEGLPIKEGLSVYLAMDLSALSTVDPEELLQTFKDKGTSHSSWVNDLEKPAFTVSPDLSELKDFLATEWGFEAVLMSGSGSTIFCLGDPSGGSQDFEAATKEKFDIEGIWKTSFMRRPSPTEWYQEV
ncbi:unnamed protein product [Durusdinium trenchii]|uniref:4-(cytidine 5'-diphospho)-2-C-methyl-D-erythritol kinase n=1 Tax=Durusdinium trenchii TaxID=1381693 RepID=A0ABP0H6Y1_9DINO